MAPKAILFDLDNTLTHRALSIDRYAERFLHEFKTQIAEADIRQISHLIARTDNGGYRDRNLNILPSARRLGTR